MGLNLPSSFLRSGRAAHARQATRSRAPRGQAQPGRHLCQTLGLLRQVTTARGVKTAAIPAPPEPEASSLKSRCRQGTLCQGRVLPGCCHLSGPRAIRSSVLIAASLVSALSPMCLSSKDTGPLRTPVILP